MVFSLIKWKNQRKKDTRRVLGHAKRSMRLERTPAA
jgi:hypothetical protein